MTFDLYLLTSFSCKPYHYLSKLHHFSQIFLFFFSCMVISFQSSYWSKDHVYLAYCISQMQSEWEITNDPSQSKNPWRPLSNYSKMGIVKNYQTKKVTRCRSTLYYIKQITYCLASEQKYLYELTPLKFIGIFGKEKHYKKCFLNYKILCIV